MINFRFQTSTRVLFQVVGGYLSYKLFGWHSPNNDKDKVRNMNYDAAWRVTSPQLVKYGGCEKSHQ